MSVARPPKTSKELANALYDDFKRKAIDEAKKRAVRQNVDYDTFKNMVLVAHLKPIQATQPTKEELGLPSWNFTADGGRIGETTEASNAVDALSSSFPNKPPSTGADFQRDWRRQCKTTDDKYRYLKLIPPEQLPAIFKVEISGELMSDIVATLESCWVSYAGAAEECVGPGSAGLEASWALEVLYYLTLTGRFKLTSQLMSRKTQASIAGIVQQLTAALPTSTDTMDESSARATSSDESATPSTASGAAVAEQVPVGAGDSGSGGSNKQSPQDMLIAVKTAYRVPD